MRTGERRVTASRASRSIATAAQIGPSTSTMRDGAASLRWRSTTERSVSGSKGFSK